MIEFPEVPHVRLFGDRRADFVTSSCECEIPVPIQTNEYGNGEPATYACTECGEALNGDSMDAPFRRWPGDLITGAVRDARLKRNEIQKLKMMVEELSIFERQRLQKLSGDAWVHAARAAIIRKLRSLRDQQLASPRAARLSTEIQ